MCCFVFSFDENAEHYDIVLKDYYVCGLSLLFLRTCPSPPPLMILLQSLVPAMAVTPALCAS